MNKEKHQDFGIKFRYRRFSHNNILELSFRKSLFSEFDKVSKLVEDVRA